MFYLYHDSNYPYPSDKEYNQKKTYKDAFIKDLQESWLITNNPLQSKKILVFWWDGIMMDAVRKLYPHNKPFFGINGWTVWFLLNNISSYKDLLDILDNTESITQHFLEGDAIDFEWKEERWILSVNDCIISWHPAVWPMNMSIRYNDWMKQHQQTISWTGVIISSIIWSTSAWMSYNHTPFEVGSWLLGVGWIGTTKSFNQKLIPSESIIEVECSSRYEYIASFDGSNKIISNPKHITIKQSKQSYTLLFDKNNPFIRKRAQLIQQAINKS